HSRRLSEKKQKYVKRDPERGEASTDPVARQEAKPKQRPEQRDEKRAEHHTRNKRPESQARDKRRDAPRRDKEQRPPREERGGVQGFGDNAPAFLKRK
ncbi:MAG TPA: hypothetical protein VEF55_06430, partial [Candidatus Binatia bacterium]|nr:hypothetical protein [Candidatus Binatia bacterium]